MNDELVLAGSFPSPIEAGLARDRLDDEGIRAFVMDSEVAAMAWHLTNAIGGVKLYVSQSDLERAHEILEELEKHTDRAEDTENEALPPEDAIRAGSPDAFREGLAPLQNDEEAPEEPLTEREQDAQRAYYGAVAGLIVLPLQLYAMLLIFAVLGSDERLRPEYRKKLQWAMLVNFPLLLIGLFLMANVLLFRD
jgi:hypothetical protein